MVLLQFKHCVRTVNRGVLHILKTTTTECIPQQTFTTPRRQFNNIVCPRHLQKTDSCFASHRLGLWCHEQKWTCGRKKIAVLGFCQRRYNTTTAKELKPTRLLTDKLHVAKKKGRSQKLKDDMNAAAYVVGDSINLSHLRLTLKEEGLYEVVDLPGDIKNAIMATAIYKVDLKVRDVFFFLDGRITCWNMPENERLEILKTVVQCTHQPLSLEAILEEEEVQPVTYNSITKFAQSTIHLKIPDDHTSDEDIALQKFAFSDAMGQTVMLALCEMKLDAFTDKIEPEMQKLRDGIPSRMIITDINKNRGEVFLLRHEINLESDLLDTPDLYWEREDLEGLYKALVDYYNIRLRILVFNERLNYCSDFLELLSNQHNDAKHVFLEKVIIVLIMIEVVFGGIPFLESYFPSLFPFGHHDVTPQASEVSQTYTDSVHTPTTDTLAASLSPEIEAASDRPL